MKTFREIREAVGAGKYSAMNLKKARELMSPAKHRKDGIMCIMKGMKVSYKQATKFHDDVMKSYGFKPEETNEIATRRGKPIFQPKPGDSPERTAMIKSTQASLQKRKAKLAKVKKDRAAAHAKGKDFDAVKALGYGKAYEGSETWEAGYKRRVVKTTKPEHKQKGYNWRIKGKDKAHLSIKLYKEKPSQSEFNKQMKRVAGHEFG